MIEFKKQRTQKFLLGSLFIGSLALAVLLLPETLLAQEKKKPETDAAKAAAQAAPTWQFGCGKANNDREICQIQRDIRQNDGKELIARIYFVREKDKKEAVARFVLPLDVNLPYGVRYSVCLLYTSPSPRDS